MRPACLRVGVLERFHEEGAHWAFSRANLPLFFNSDISGASREYLGTGVPSPASWGWGLWLREGSLKAVFCVTENECPVQTQDTEAQLNGKEGRVSGVKENQVKFSTDGSPLVPQIEGILEIFTNQPGSGADRSERR